MIQYQNFSQYAWYPGLCGLADGDIENDLMTRAGVIVELVTGFGLARPDNVIESWR